MILKDTYDIVIIGSGPGGLAAAVAAKKEGAEDVLVIERDGELGGILLQCIHNGFGLEIFNEDLPGPSYAQRYVEESLELGVETLLDTIVLEVTPDRKLFVSSKQYGFFEINARAIVLAMGCRERTRAMIQIPGMRPAGIYTAGTAQRFVNIEGKMPGEKVVILGSGDIGMIMARRLTFEGAKVERVLEILPYLSGLTRNYVQCLQDFDIPLLFQHTIKFIHGKNRVEAVETVAVDDKWNFIPGSEEMIPCDTLLLSIGLIPENELSRQAGVEIDPITGGPFVDESRQTNVPGIFAAGNVVHVYDLADWVTLAGYEAGKGAAKFAMALRASESAHIPVIAGNNVHHVVPQTINKFSLEEDEIELQLRVRAPVEARVMIEVHDGKNQIAHRAARYARPGEMNTITLKPKIFADVEKASSITVDVNPR
ncbi:MAG: NAD(P)/FAD-dependent oxidoreductase [Chloroflexota bacterium]|nr:NAD(P)/FAD-dependent oxidoreductase [Chloroflexota bacterium]